MPHKQKYKNHLILIRNKSGLGQKQVAVFLGHKLTNQISRYERGLKLPSFKTALKLGIIYRMPLRVLFYDYYKACLEEIKKLKREADLTDSEIELCTFEEKLKPRRVSESELNKARDHITALVKARSKKMKHTTSFR